MDRNFSQEEARQIFAAAAERQRAEQSTPDSALSLTDLEEAAAAAGLDPAHVRAAAMDLLRPDHAPVNRRLLGFPVEFRQTIHLPTLLTEERWGEIVLMLRRVYEKRGIVSDLAGIREWVSEGTEKRMPVRVIAEAEGDGTRITIERKTWQQAFGLAMGSGSLMFTALLLMIVWSATGTAGMWMPAALLAVLSVVMGVASAFGLRLANTRDRKKAADVMAQIRTIAKAGEHEKPSSARQHEPAIALKGLEDDATSLAEHPIAPQAARSRS